MAQERHQTIGTPGVSFTLKIIRYLVTVVITTQTFNEILSTFSTLDGENFVHLLFCLSMIEIQGCGVFFLKMLFYKQFGIIGNSILHN